MSQANKQLDPKAAGAIMQNQIDTLQCTVQCLTTQRNATSDALTSAQTTVMMKDRQITAMNGQINALNELLTKAKAQSELWNGRYNEVSIQKSALVWFAEQLLIEIPDSKISAISPEIIGSIIESYNDHLKGEKLKNNMLRYTEIIAAKANGEEVETEVEQEPNDAVNEDHKTEPAEEETEEPVVELTSSLVKKDRPTSTARTEPTVIAKPSLKEQAQRKIKGQDRASNS